MPRVARRCRRLPRSCSRSRRRARIDSFLPPGRGGSTRSVVRRAAGWGDSLSPRTVPELRDHPTPSHVSLCSSRADPPPPGQGDAPLAAQLICPTGKSANLLSSPLAKNISHNPSGKSSLQLRAIPPSREGRIAIVTDVGCGMRWTRQRQAHRCARRMTLQADGEAVWSWRTDAGVKFAGILAGDGGKRARSPGRARNKR
jgi:hypothetical protein